MNRRRFLGAVMALLFCLLLSGCQGATTVPALPSADSTATADAAATQTPAPSASGKEGIQGLVLVVPVLVENVELVKNDVRENGAYREELLFDGTVSVVVERVAGIEFSEDAIAGQISSLNGVEAGDITIKQDDTIASRISYPAWRITYTTGANEDTRKNVDVYIQTDDWDYRLHTSTPADLFEDYEESIEAWIESANLFDGT